MNTTNRQKLWLSPVRNLDWVTAHFGHR